MQKTLTKCDICSHRVDLRAAQAFNKRLAQRVVTLINVSREEKGGVVHYATILEYLQGALKDACREADKFTPKGFSR